MKYFIRSVKYFFYFAILCSAIITVLVLIGAVGGSIDAIFEEGYKSIVKMALFFAVIAAIYPKFGFIRREIESDRSWSEARSTITDYMAEHHYIIEKESPQEVTFRVKGFVGRLTKMFEDRITLTKTTSGWVAEGLRKDTYRLASGIEYRLAPKDSAQG